MINKMISTVAVAIAIAVSADAGVVGYFGALSGNATAGTGTNSCPAQTTLSYYANYQQTNVLVTNGVAYQTNLVTTTASTNMATIQRSRFITIQAMFTMMGLGSGAGEVAGQSNCVFRVDNSNDAQNWNIGYTNISVQEQGTNPAVACVNIDTGGAIYWRVGQFQNTNNVAASNIVANWSGRDGL